MLLNVPAPLAAGEYLGNTPPVPVYVTNAVLESEVTATPVIAVAVTPGRTLVSAGVTVKVRPLPSGGHAPKRGEGDGFAAFKVTTCRSVKVGTGVTVAPKMWIPSVVAVTRS